MCCKAIASILSIPDTLSEDAGVPPVTPVAAVVGVVEEEDGPDEKDCDVALAFPLLPRIPRTVDNATPLLAATFSMGHAPCILACTVASPARTLSCCASIKLLSADCSNVWIWECSAIICWGRGKLDGSLFLLLLEEERRGDPAAASAGERPPLDDIVAEFILFADCPPSFSTVNNAGAIVFTEANVLRCCIMS